MPSRSPQTINEITEEDSKRFFFGTFSANSEPYRIVLADLRCLLNVECFAIDHPRRRRLWATRRLLEGLVYSYSSNPQGTCICQSTLPVQSSAESPLPDTFQGVAIVSQTHHLEEPLRARPANTRLRRQSLPSHALPACLPAYCLWLAGLLGLAARGGAGHPCRWCVLAVCMRVHGQATVLQVACWIRCAASHASGCPSCASTFAR